MLFNRGNKLKNSNNDVTTTPLGQNWGPTTRAVRSRATIKSEIHLYWSLFSYNRDTEQEKMMRPFWTVLGALCILVCLSNAMPRQRENTGEI